MKVIRIGWNNKRKLGFKIERMAPSSFNVWWNVELTKEPNVIHEFRRKKDAIIWLKEKKMWVGK